MCLCLHCHSNCVCSPYSESTIDVNTDSGFIFTTAAEAGTDAATCRLKDLTYTINNDLEGNAQKHA